MTGSRLKSWPDEYGLAKTCPRSRHAAMIANSLRSKQNGEIGKLLREAGYDADHMADAIEGVVVDLWSARRFLEWVELPTTKRHPLHNGHWTITRAALQAMEEKP